MRFLVLLFLANILYAESDECAEDENLFLPFNFMTYNQLDHFEQIEQEGRGTGDDREFIIEEMLNRFRGNEMGKYAGVNVLHNHVTIAEDEIMLEVPVQDATDTNMISVMGPMKLNEIENIDKVPYLFKLNVETRKWVPLEFVVKNEIITESYTKFITNHEFQVELIDLIIQLGVADKFGITLKRRTQTNTVEESGFNGGMHYIFEVVPGIERTAPQFQVGYWSDSKLGEACLSHGNCVHCGNHCGNHCQDHCGSYWSHHKAGGINVTDPIYVEKMLPKEEHGFVQLMDKGLTDFLRAYLTTKTS